MRVKRIFHGTMCYELPPGRRKLQRKKKTITREIVLNRDNEAESCEESQSP